MNKVYLILSLAALFLVSCGPEQPSEEFLRVRDILMSRPYWAFNTTEMQEMIPSELESRDLRIASITTRNLEGVILEFHADSTVTINIPAKDQQTGRWMISEKGDSMSLMTGVGSPAFQFIQEISAEKLILSANPVNGALVPKVIYALDSN